MIAISAAIQIIYGFTMPVVGDDAWFHLNWLDQFHQLRTAGVDYPRWLSFSYGGFGSPTFYFYPPLPYFIGSWIQSVASSLSISAVYHILGFIATALSCWTFFLFLCSAKVEQRAALAGALLYAIAPYRFVDLYARCALGEHFSFIFLPLLLAGIEIARGANGDWREQLRAAVITAIGTSGVILVNIPATVIFALTAIAYALARCWKEWRTLLAPALGALVGVLICSGYLLPLLEMREHVQMNHIFDIGSQEQRWSYILIEIFQGQFTAARILNIVTLVASIIIFFVLLLKRRKDEANSKGVLTGVIVLLGFGIFFQLPAISALIYEITPIDLIKYSWRWNVVLSLGIATSVAMMRTGKRTWITVSALGAMLLCTLFVGNRYAREFAVHRSPDVLKEYYNDAPEYVPTFAPKEYYDVTHFGQVNKLAPRVIFDARLGDIGALALEPERLTYSVNARANMIAVFHQFYWPQWQLWKGSKQIPTGYDEYGRAVAELEKGQYNVEFRLEPTSGQTTGVWLTLLGASLLLAAIVYSLMLTKRAKAIQPST
jgi:hypothetical protein